MTPIPNSKIVLIETPLDAADLWSQSFMGQTPETKVSVSHVVMVLLVTAVASPIFLTNNEEIISSIQLGICGLLISLHRYTGERCSSFAGLSSMVGFKDESYEHSLC